MEQLCLAKILKSVGLGAYIYYRPLPLIGFILKSKGSNLAVATSSIIRKMVNGKEGP